MDVDVRQFVGDVSALRIAVVAARWHERFMQGLLEGATRAIGEVGAPTPQIIRVPGAFELPVVCARVVRQPYDAIVALGVILKGGTPAHDYVAQSVTQGLSRVSTSSGIPIGFGILICDNEAQARDRSGLSGAHESKGYEAALVALSTAATLRQLEQHA